MTTTPKYPGWYINTDNNKLVYWDGNKWFMRFLGRRSIFTPVTVVNWAESSKGSV